MSGRAQRALPESAALFVAALALATGGSRLLAPAGAGSLRATLALASLVVLAYLVARLVGLAAEFAALRRRERKALERSEGLDRALGKAVGGSP